MARGGRGAVNDPATIARRCGNKVRPADVAQLVEHFTRNEGVRGSNPRVGFQEIPQMRAFSMPAAGHRLLRNYSGSGITSVAAANRPSTSAVIGSESNVVLDSLMAAVWD